MQNILPKDLQHLRDAGEPFTLLDVREPDEIQQACIDPHLAIPMALIPLRLAELDRSGTIVVMCHTGIRSSQVVQYLDARGYARVLNLSGGIDRWSREIDPEVPLY